jgi:hypothetical protein
LAKVRIVTITLPGTDYQITYRKLADSPGVSLERMILRQDDPEASLNRYEFLARAWNAKARELGWIV